MSGEGPNLTDEIGRSPQELEQTALQKVRWLPRRTVLPTQTWCQLQKTLDATNQRHDCGFLKLSISAVMAENQDFGVLR